MEADQIGSQCTSPVKDSNLHHSYSGGGEKGFKSGYILKVVTVGFADKLAKGCERSQEYHCSLGPE